jgi:DNA-binding NtrC family response regulator
MARILLVENDADVQGVVSEFLTTIEHQVTCASSAEQARLILARERVDLALVDCLMSGEPGDALAGHLTQLGIPTVLTSGDPLYIDTLAEQPVPFLPKPFRLAALEELISRMLQAIEKSTRS